MHRVIRSVLAVGLLFGAIGVALTSPAPRQASATDIVPGIVDSNVDCTTVTAPTYRPGLKVDSGRSGTYPLPNGGQVNVVNSQSKYITWSSTSPIDAVIVFGGSSANVYRAKDLLGDSGLSAPQKKATLPPDISHVWFCEDGMVDVSVDTKANAADTQGTLKVNAARGVALSDIPFDVLNSNDPAVVASVYSKLAAAAALKISPGLKISAPLKISPPLKISDTFRVAAPLKISPALKISAALKISPAILRVIAALKISAPLKISPTDGAILQTPLSELVLDLVAPDGSTVTWARVLAGTQYEGSPLNDVTFLDVADLIQQAQAASNPPVYPGGIGLVADASLFQIDSTGAMIGRLSVLSLLLITTPLQTLTASTASGNSIDWCKLSEPYTGNTCVIQDPSKAVVNGVKPIYADATLLELALQGVPSSIVPVWDIDMAKLRSAFANQPAPKSPLANALLGDFDGDGTPEATPFCTTALTLGNCLAELIGAKDFPWEDLPIGSLQLERFALGDRLPINIRFASPVAAPSVAVTLPTGFVYDKAAGGKACVFANCTTVLPTSIVTNSAGLQVVTFSTGIPAGYVTLSLKAATVGKLPDVALPPKGTVGVTVSFGSTSTTTSVPGPEVVDPWTAGAVPVIKPDTFYFGNVAQNGSNNYDVVLDPSQAGSWLSVRFSAITEGLDGDLSLYAQSPEPALKDSAALKISAPLKISPIGSSSQPVPDPGATTNDALAPETLQDVPTVPDDPDFPLLKTVGANRGPIEEMETISQTSSTAPTTYRIKISAYGTSSGLYALRVVSTPSGVSACPSKTFTGSLGALGVPTGQSASAAQGVVVYNANSTTNALLGSPADSATTPTLYGLARKSNAVLQPVSPSAADLWTTPQAGSLFDCAPVAANAVVEAIAGKIRALKASTPGIATVVIVGGDDKLPFYRMPDTTTLGNESQHSGEIGTNNPISASLGARFFLSDDPYGTLNPIPWLDRTFNVPDLAVGRLVETESEISGQIAQYQGAALNPSTALVTGYDFLSDAASEIKRALVAAGYSDTAIPATLKELNDPIGDTDTWTAQQLRDAIAANPGIASINAHFSQYAMLSSFGDRTGTYDVLDLEPNDPLNTKDKSIDFSTIPLSVLQGTILFSAGCHSGLEVPDAYANDTVTNPLLKGATAGIPYDWAQAFGARRAAVWVANSGYGYGSPTDTVLTERLMAIFSRFLLDPATTGVGQAFVKAKQEYFLGQGVYGSYDEKALQQVIFYGIPNFSINRSAQPTQNVQAAATSVPGTLAISSVTPRSASQPASATTGDVNFNFASTTLNGRTAWAVVDGNGNRDTLAVNGYPVVPKTSFDVTKPGYIARGAIIESMSTSQVENVLPQIARATINDSASEPAIQPGQVVFPTAFQTVTGTETQQRLVVYPGQFSDLSGAATGSQMLINSARYTVYYADPATQGDTTRPYIQESTASSDVLPDGRGVVLFRVEVQNPKGLRDTVQTPISRVLVQYDALPGSNAGHAWTPVELQPEVLTTPAAPGAPIVYVGALVTDRTDGRYFIQVADLAGNGAISQLKGKYFVAGGTAPQAVAVVTKGTLEATGWYRGPALVSLFIGGKEASLADGYTYYFDGVAQGTYDEPIAMPDGTTTVTFLKAGSTNPAPPALTVKKDTVKPIARLVDQLGPDSKPLSVPVIAKGGSVPKPVCDPLEITSLPVTCPVVVDGTVTVTDPGTTTSNSYTLYTAQATDAAGNQSDFAKQTAVIIDGTYDEVNKVWTAADEVTVVAAGPLAQQATFTTTRNGVTSQPQQGVPTGDNISTLSIVDPGDYKVDITLPGSGGTANVTISVNFSISDTRAPVITAPDLVTKEATSPSGATVDFASQVSAFDDPDGPRDVTCSPTSGTTFPLDDTTVVCSSSDRTGNTSTRNITVRVVDTTPPALSVAVNPVVVEATSGAGAAVNYSANVSASDIVDTAPAITCVPGSGTTFPIGNTTVSCTARDFKGNTSAAKTFVVTVRDSTKPVLAGVPASQTVEGNFLGGAKLDFSPTATDTVSGTLAVQCTTGTGTTKTVVDSNYLFKVFVTTAVTCTATDSSGNTASATFSVYVDDTKAPVITGVPNDFTVAGTTSTGGTVYYTKPIATDIVAGTVPVNCSPASGTVFQYGTWTVTCTASDGKNTATATFKVTVTVAYRYNGFFSPVNMAVTGLATYDIYGLTNIVNTVNGGRNVPFKWEAYDNLTSNKLVDVSRVEIVVSTYAQFYDTFAGKIGLNSPLPGRDTNPCSGRPQVPVSSSTLGKTTSVKFENGQFNIGVQMPAKPKTGVNCFVAWTRITSPLDPMPGIVVLFSMT